MKQRIKKEKKWWQHLLIIPIMLVIDVLALLVAGMMDTSVAGDGLGHPVPVFFILVVIICGLLTVVLTIRALFLCLRTIFHGNTDYEQNALLGRKKSIWHCYIPLMVEIPVALLAVIICGYWEISSFYNNPAHVGFAFPITTFVLAGVCLLVTGVIGVFCVIAAIIRKKRNKKLEECK